jgi:hypothetical protein
MEAIELVIGVQVISAFFAPKATFTFVAFHKYKLP